MNSETQPRSGGDGSCSIGCPWLLVERKPGTSATVWVAGRFGWAGYSVVLVGSEASQGRSSPMLRADILGKFRVRNAQFILV